jgi:hypothetical protein
MPEKLPDVVAQCLASCLDGIDPTTFRIRQACSSVPFQGFAYLEGGMFLDAVYHVLGQSDNVCFCVNSGFIESTS